MELKKTLLAILFTLTCVVCGMAQANKTVEDITKVKCDTSYIYAEATMKSAEEAFVGAKSIIEVKIGDWVRKQGLKGVDVCIAKAKEHILEIQTRRGDYYRAFVYVNKKDIMPVVDKNEVVVFDVKKQKKMNTTSIDIISEDERIEPKPAMVLTADEKNMTSINQFVNIEQYLSGLKNQGKLESYGKYKTMPTSGQVYCFVYDKTGTVVAQLRRDGNDFVNLKTFATEMISDYKNCGAIWLRLKQ